MTHGRQPTAFAPPRRQRRRSHAAGHWLLGLAFLVVATLVLLAGSPARAVEVEFIPRPLSREILALYDARHERNPGSTRIHKFAEMPLNFLGLKLTYVDVNGPLPDPAELSRYRGMISWLSEPLARQADYLDWLDRATAAGLRFALLAELAPPESEVHRPVIDRILRRLGLRPTGEYVNITRNARVVTADADMIGFERPLDKALPDFTVLTPIPGEATVHLAIEAPLRDMTVTGAVVTTSPAGGYVSDEYAMFYDANTDRLRWNVNPFAFFKRVFVPERMPMPDVTTASGRRIYFSHIDGDGWNNVSEIPGYREAQALCAEVIAREAVEPYPDLPVSVGLIAGDVDASLGGNPAAAAAARRLFALPQVEVASHTYTHPFDWEFFENYDRKVELERIEKFARPAGSFLDNVRATALRLAGRQPTNNRLNKYIAGSADLPRSYMLQPFDVEKEIRGALKGSEALAPAGKKAAIMLWSGDTMPFEAALRVTREAGARNMNGGDTRLDNEYPSVFYVPPIARPVGAERQIYAVNSNENTYTNFWHGPFYGYFSLEQTHVNTETPRRLKAMNVYYHMYIGEKPASLASLKHFLDIARRSEVIPMTASQYAAIADDFFSTAVEQVGPEAWAITARGALQTIRFDDAEALAVDLTASQGVLGANRANGALYVALDAAVPRAVVALARVRSAPAPAAANSPPVASLPAVPHDGQLALLQARWALSERQAESCAVSATARGFGPGEMTWQGDPGRRYSVTASRANTVLWQGTHQADAAGLVRLRVEASAMEPLHIRLACHD